MATGRGAPRRAGKADAGARKGVSGGRIAPRTGKPAAGRTARPSASAGTPPERTGGKKQRWSEEQRIARGLGGDRPRGKKGGRLTADGGGRPNWEPRGKEARRTTDAPAGERRRFDRDDRPERSRPWDRDDRRPARDRDDRERPAATRDDDRRPVRDDRPPRDRDRDDRRPPRDRDERPFRDRDDRRPPRDRDRDDRRPSRDRDRDDRPRDRDRDHRRPPRDDRPQRDDAPRSAAPRSDDPVLERLEAEAVEASDVEGVSFGDLGLGQNIVRALAELGADAPFAIQAGTIPDALAGRDVLGRGRTGSGKTIAFAAPLVERILQGRASRTPGERRQPGRAPEALIIAPTRELALQIDRTVQPIARSVGLFTTQVYGGVPYAKQYGALSRGVDIVIGTPGRVEDLVEQGRLDLSRVSITVLDEADHMTDLGFLEPVQRILRRTADDGQRMLFSATLDTAVAALVEEFLDNPAVHEVAGEQATGASIEHHVFLLDQRDKIDVLTELAQGPAPKLVFVRTRSFAEDVSDLLDDNDIDAVALHGDLTQPRRTRNLERFSRGRASVLVATDVAARGIHIDDVALIVQADAPDEYKTYLHRSGRTGRAGKTGIVVTLVARNRRRRVEELLSRAGIQAEWTMVRPGDATVRDLVDRANAAALG